MPEVDGIQIPFIPAGGIQELQRSKNLNQNVVTGNKFGKIFEDEINSLKFSAHAKARIASREINLGENDINRLNNAFERAKSKGAKESLVIMDDKAFIINVSNRTVITAVDKKQLDSNVITNIDSAVIA